MKKRKLIIIIIIILLAFGGYLSYTYLFHSHAGHTDEEKQLYTCPMHPQIIQDHPGDCPICGMKLVPLKKEEQNIRQKAEIQQEKKKEKKIMYKSTMLPGEISDRPGKDSMGMDMVPFNVQDGEGEKAIAVKNIKTPAGLAPVTITKEQKKMMGLGFETVKFRNIVREIRTSGKIVPDETRLYKVTTKTTGWVEKLFVNQTGQFVSKGSPLLTIYSPELLSAQQEYLSAMKAREKLSSPEDAAMSKSMEDIEAAALERLKYLDISDEEIQRIKNTGSIERNVTLRSPASGFVTEKMVLPGQKLAMNDALMVIVDLSRVWAEIDIYEADLPYVKIGMQAEVTLPYWQGKIFKGRVSFMNPFMDPDARTLKARIEIVNTDYVLKPNMYGDARLKYNTGKKLAVPQDAVMQTGVLNYVFIEGKNDLIVPYEVNLGVRSGDGYYEVISGLKQGERVVTSANFLVDSESSLKAAFKEAVSGRKQ